MSARGLKLVKKSSKDGSPARKARRSGHGGVECPRSDYPDPESAALLHILNLTRVRHPTFREDRMTWRVAAAMLARASAVARIETRHIPGPGGPIELVLYRPVKQDSPSPAFVWFHGGGFVIGGLATADTICRHIAIASGAVVVAVRYRLVPEHDLFAGREDCLAVVKWLADNGPTLGIDPTRLAVGGDSAGGNLAAAVAQRSEGRVRRALRLQVLVYPATNLHDEFESKYENAHGFMLTAERVDANKALLRRQQPDLSDPWLSPALTPELKDLTPALVLTAGFDPIRDDGLIYAERLRAAGVPVELLHYAGQFHGFINFDGVLLAARDALDRMGASLKRAFEPQAGEPPAAVDRTLELSARVRDGTSTSAAGARETVLLASLMLGERLEGWRTTIARAFLPNDPWVHALNDSPLLNPVTAYRARLAEHYSPIEARETYSGPAGGAVRRLKRAAQ